MKVLKQKVFVLNCFWQLINETTVVDALTKMAADTATALNFASDDDDAPVPTKWEDWIKLPILNAKELVRTQKLQIRMPTVIVAVNYAGLPKRKPKFTLKNIAKRDRNRCQYTDELLSPNEMSMDHVDPLSRGGADSPENVVLTSKKFNNLKGNKTPEEMGVKRPKIRKLGVFSPEPTHNHHKKFSF